jgi:hypothetical protein
LRGRLLAVVMVMCCVGAAPLARASPFRVESGASPEATPPADSGPVPSRERLSDERRLSRWAFVVKPVVARKAPRADARRIKRFDRLTADRTRELFLALEQRVLADGAVWVRVRLPMRPNNRTGWVPRSRLGAFRVVRTRLVIDRRRLRATLYRKGRRVWRAPVGVGRSRWPTPRGRFYVRERLVPKNKSGIYGVFAFGTSGYSTKLTDWPGGGVVGIHGTNQPELIPGRISHGCVRVRNGKIQRLRRLMPLGTPTRIR